MVRVCVLRRNNDFIMKVLSHLKNESRFLVKSVVADENSDIEGKYSCPICNSDPFKYAVLLTAMKNDIETLKALKIWSDANFECGMCSVSECDCPMVIACIENHNQCIQTLYDMNYRIRIAEKCEKKIKLLIDVNHDPNKAKRHTAGLKPFVRVGGQDRETAETFSDEDVIVRLLNLKAYTNFHYLAAEFNEAMEATREARTNQLPVTNKQKEKLKFSDPMRKSLAIAHYVGSNIAVKDSTYRKEYTEVVKVSH